MDNYDDDIMEEDLSEYDSDDTDDYEDDDRMEGDFSFSSIPLGMVACLIWMFVPAVLYVAVDNKIIGMILAVVVFVIFFALTIWSSYIPGKFIADDKGVTFSILFRKHSFLYSNIRSVSVSKSKGDKHNRSTGEFSVKTELVICTKFSTRSFTAESACDFSPDEPLNDADGFNKRVNELEFFRLAKFIEKHIKK